jgi:hypothetical protein
MEKTIAQQLELDRGRCIELCDLLKRITTKNKKMSIGEAIDIALPYCDNERERRFIYYIIGSLVGLSLEHENKLKFIDNLIEELDKSESETFMATDENFNPQLN